MDVTVGDFCPINRWKEDVNGPKWTSLDGGKSEFLVDQTTGRRYWNESLGIVRTKCGLLAVGTIPVHVIASVINVAARALQLVSFAHFWTPIRGENGYQLKTRAKAAGQNLLHIVAAPLVIAGLELSAIYGLIGSPYSGRKMYATIERTQYGGFLLAPCFQPDPESHAFGGNPSTKNAW